MNLLAWLLAGSLIGWLSGRMMKARREPGTALDVIVGMAGAFAAGYLIAPWLGIGSIHQQEFDLASLTVGVTGAVVLLGLFNLFRRRLLR
jgi:uncharacterized membrane protein YeaQ/YmgE (transglycosylase-associated protein family)